MLRDVERGEIGNRQQALNLALLGEDQLGVVVRAHIYVEQLLIEFIKARLTPASVVESLDLDYAGRVRLALALGLQPDFKPGLNFIGTLRNRFAHRLDATISSEDADNFARALGPHKAVATDSFDKLRKIRELQAPLAKRSPLDRVIIYFVTLWNGVAVATYYARR